MTKIAVDIDDTLYSFNNLAREVFVDVAIEKGNKRYQRGAYCAWGEWRSPPDVTDDDVWMEVIERCHSPEMISQQVPFSNASDTLTELAEQGYELRYISNRDPLATSDTKSWIDYYNFPDGELICTREDKLPQIRDCMYLIDDRPKTLIQFVYDFHWKHRYGSENKQYERKGFGLYMPYNAALTDVPGIKLAPNWKLLRQYLIETDVLQERSKVGTIS